MVLRFRFLVRPSFNTDPDSAPAAAPIPSDPAAAPASTPADSDYTQLRTALNSERNRAREFETRSKDLETQLQQAQQALTDLRLNTALDQVLGPNVTPEYRSLLSPVVRAQLAVENDQVIGQGGKTLQQIAQEVRQAYPILFNSSSVPVAPVGSPVTPSAPAAPTASAQTVVTAPNGVISGVPLEDLAAGRIVVQS